MKKKAIMSNNEMEMEMKKRGFCDDGGSLSKSIFIVGGLIITLLVLGTAFGIWFGVKPMITKVGKDVSNYGVILDESKYTDNDGQYMTGNQVISNLRTWSRDDVCIKVITKSNTAGTCYNYKNFDETTGLAEADKLSSTDNNKLISSAGNKTAANYINPNAQFFCEIKRNQNDVIVAAVITQQ